MRVFTLVASLTLSACSSLPQSHTQIDANTLATMKLIAQTEAAAPNAVKGKFSFFIKAVGQQRGYTYLNTELDYRDRRAITIELTPKAKRQFIKLYGQEPKDFFINKQIEVTGEARQMKIDFYCQHKRTDAYYFQTFVKVTDLTQLKVLN